jgi:peroxiredoxin
MRLTLALLWLLGQGLLQAQSPAADSTHIAVTIEGLPAGIARLVGTYGEQNYLADSARVDASGHFVLRRARPLPVGFYYFLLPGQKNFSILVDEDQHFSLKAKVSDIPGTLEVQGSLSSELLYASQRFQAQQEPELGRVADQMRNNPPNSAEHQQAKARQSALLAERKAFLDDIFKKHPDVFFTRFKIAGQNPDIVEFRKPNGDIDTLRQLMSYRARFWDGVDFSDERLLHTPVIVNKLRRYIKELTPQHPDSLLRVSDALIRRVLPHKPYFQFFANWIALQHENTKTNVMDGEAVYVHIVNTFFTDELATWDKPENLAKLRKHVWEMEASLLGRKGPDVRAADVVSGQEKGIYDLKSPLVVVFMFSPDCEHCQKDAPRIREIANTWKSRGVEFFGIGVNTEAEPLRKFVQQHNFPFSTVFDPTNRAIYAKYYVDITPELYVLNKDRTIVAKNLKPEQLEIIFERELRKMK